jgi:DNA-binding CsgD family transcriptional regulator
MHLLHEISGADHCAAFQFGGESIHALITESLENCNPATTYAHRYVDEGIWLRDPAISAARGQLGDATTGLVHADINDQCYKDIKSYIFPQVRDRLLLCRRRENSIFGVSVIRTDPGQSFGADAIQQLADVSAILVSSLIKHVNVRAPRPDVSSALTNLAEIERCIIARSSLPRRETEVCARILYGVSSIGIAIDLGIGEESVKTYRKRAYQRLGIGCERELLQWYLSNWSAWAECRFAELTSAGGCSGQIVSNRQVGSLAVGLPS